MEDKLIVSKVHSKGYGIIPKMVMQDQRLHINAKAIYAYFTSYAGAGNCAFPTRKKIQYDLGISSDTFGKYLKQLTDTGYIDVKQNKVKGKFSNNVYTLCDTVSTDAENTDTEKTDTENVGNGKTGNENVGNDEMVTNINKSFKNNSSNSNSVNSNSPKRKKEKGKPFTPPSVEEVAAYCQERNNHVNPEQFVDYYIANGWMVGKNNMKDWKASVRTWERRQNESKPAQQQNAVGQTGIEIIEQEDNMLAGVFKS